MAQPLGRLFFSPEQREAFDQQRRAQSEPPAPREPVVDGIVRRSSGRHTMWLDGKPQPADESSLPALPSQAPPKVPAPQTLTSERPVAFAPVKSKRTTEERP